MATIPKISAAFIPLDWLSIYRARWVSTRKSFDFSVEKLFNSPFPRDVFAAELMSDE
jgi:hypothetical protein